MKKIFEIINLVKEKEIRNIIKNQSSNHYDDFEISKIITLFNISKQISPNINEEVLSIKALNDNQLKLGNFDIDNISLNEFLGMTASRSTINNYSFPEISFYSILALTKQLNDIMICFNHKDMLDIASSIDEDSFYIYHMSDSDHKNIVKFIKNKIN